MDSIFDMINNVSAAYEQTMSEKREKNIAMEAGFIAREKNLEMMRHIDEMRSLSNRREKVDDEGNIIPFEDENKESWLPARIKDKTEVSWICDKCMAINFGCQTACPECGDIKDVNDERLK